MSARGCVLRHVIKTITSPRHLRIAGFAVAAVALAGSAVYITASAAGYSLGFHGSPPTGNAASSSAAASALGITPETLQADLKKGMTLSQIAAAQKPPVTEAQFRTKLIANIKPLLDKAVADKKMTSDQEQKFLQRLQTGPIPFWNKPLPKATAA